MSATATHVSSALADWAARDRAAALRLFVPEARTPGASARLAVGHALRESAWMGSEARISEAKSAWWLEELALTGRGQPRHPLTSHLASEMAPPDFAKLAQELARLMTIAPDGESAVVLSVLGQMEETLWFGPIPFDSTACMTRARAALVDVLERRSQFTKVDEACRTGASAALRAATAGDSWTAARRTQVLCWIDARNREPTTAGMESTWREVWAVWRAVQTARWSSSATKQTGGKHGK